MTDQVTIANLALSAIGTRSTISSLTEGSAESNQINLHWQPALNRMLRAAPWNFARKQINLTLLRDSTATPAGNVPPPWVYEYAYPSDCLALRYLMPTFQNVAGQNSMVVVPDYIGPPVRYLVSSDVDSSGNDIKVILTNQYQAIAVYTKSINNPALFDDTFVEAFANYLAWRIAIPLSGDKALAKMALEISTQRVIEAKAENGNEGLVVIDSTPDWIRTRGYLSDWSFPDGGYNEYGPSALSFVN